MIGLITIAIIVKFAIFKTLDHYACEWREPAPARCAVEEVVE